MAFCTSIRRRSSFASVVPALSANGFLKENKLISHDISIALSSQSAIATTTSRHIRVLLLSPRAISDQEESHTLERLRRFAALTGGKDLVAVFLLELSQKDKSANNTGLSHNDDSSNGLVAYSQLQVLLHAHPEVATIPVLPLASLDHLPTLLKKHVSSMVNQQNRPQQTKASKPWDILRYCTMNPPMDETMAYCITDVFANIRELALACSTEVDEVLQSQGVPSSDRTIGHHDVSHYFSSSSSVLEGSGIKQEKSELAKKLGKLRAVNEEAARDVVMFWQEEWLID